MINIDPFSYHCGVIDCFNEMIQMDVKQLALSHPLTKEENCTELQAFIKQTCKAYGTRYFYEENLLVSTLFPTQETIAVYLFYKDEHILQAYEALKQCVIDDEQNRVYTPKRQAEIAASFAQLLSYPKHIYEAMIQKNNR